MVDAHFIPEHELTGELPAELEMRIQRLEAAVTALQDTPLMEERVVEKVIQRLKRMPIKSLRESTEAMNATNESTTVSPEDGQAPAPDLTISAAAGRTDRRRGWFLFDLWKELRTIGQMFFDHRYHFSWIGRIVPTVLITMYVAFWILIPPFLVFQIIERALDIAVIVILYFVLSREARMYRSAYPYR
jgi:hypothetical protein